MIDRESVDAAISSRRSVRAFLPAPVPRTTIEAILAVASRAPSGTNMQPWRVYVVTGAAKQRLVHATLAAFDDAHAKHEFEHRFYPNEWFEPCIGRRRKLGWDLYGLVGIRRGESAKMHAQHGRNFAFFDAPVGMIFTIDRRLEIGSWLDYGMFLENIMIAARAHGLDTCPQAAWVPYHAIVREVLGVPAGEMVVCGMALGYADPAKPENTLVTERAPLESFVSFHDTD